MNAARAGHFTRRDRSRAGPSGLRVPQTKRTKPASGTTGTSGRRASRVGSGGRCIIGTELRRCIDAESVTSFVSATIPLLHHALCLARSGRRATTTERTSPHPAHTALKRHDIFGIGLVDVMRYCFHDLPIVIEERILFAAVCWSIHRGAWRRGDLRPSF